MFKQNKEKKINIKNGYVMLLTVVIFMMVSLIISFGLTTPIIKQILSSRDIWGARQAYYLSEAGLEDSIFRIKSNMTIGSNETLNIDNFNTTTLVNRDSLTGDYTVRTSDSDYNNYERKLEIKVIRNGGASFNYGVQVGNGGFTMYGGKIIGNVYSNGTIISNNSSSQITGSVIVANSPDLFIDQENYLPEIPSNSITFGTSTSYEDFAQSFKVSTTSPITQINLYLKKISNPLNITLSIRPDFSGIPNPNTIIASGTLYSSLVTNNYGWVEIPLSSNPNLIVGNTYWITIDSSNDSAKYYSIAANLDSSYLNGTTKVGKIGGTWYSANYDSYFKIFLGGRFGMIFGLSMYNPISIGGDAYAHNLSYVQAVGNLKCQVGISNNGTGDSLCNSSYPDPSSLSMPVSDNDIQDWKTDAQKIGTYNGDKITPNYGTSSFSGKINGNLTVLGGHVLYLTGTTWVTGDITLSGDSKIVLDPVAYGNKSGVIISDGVVTISNSCTADGSGIEGSNLLILTTSSCDAQSSCDGKYAIDVSGNAGALILNAEKGTIHFRDGFASEVTANRVLMDGNPTITYKSGLINPNFNVGPSGSWNIGDWKELEE